MSDEALKEPPRLTSDELRELARDIVTNKTFIANDERAVESAFMMIKLFDWDGWDLTKIGAFYADYADAGPRSVNGYPCFFSCKILHADDIEPLKALWDEMLKALS